MHRPGILRRTRRLHQCRPWRRRHDPGGTRVGEARAARAASDAEPDGLDLEKLVDAREAPLAAEPGLLDTAERRRRVGDHALVEADHPGLQRLAHPDPAREVTG